MIYLSYKSFCTVPTKNDRLTRYKKLPTYLYTIKLLNIIFLFAFHSMFYLSEFKIEIRRHLIYDEKIVIEKCYVKKHSHLFHLIEVSFFFIAFTIIFIGRWVLLLGC